MNRVKLVFASILIAVTLPASAALNIFACTPEWGSLAAELGGDKANVFNATNALQDPHRVEARPSLIARARSADLVVCTGAELEIGWLPLVLTQSGNPKIQIGQPGYFEAAGYVELIDRRKRASFHFFVRNWARDPWTSRPMCWRTRAQYWWDSPWQTSNPPSTAPAIPRHDERCVIARTP